MFEIDKYFTLEHKMFKYEYIIFIKTFYIIKTIIENETLSWKITNVYYLFYKQ